ncbi:MAG TPA: hypothetical protein VF121_19685 [Thermoanaerobaculia bacterium]|nr:hypothetical protein [Thermoanaerobaculia bacterium]
MADIQGSLVERVRAGGDRQLQRLAAAGLLPLPPEELIPLQVALARGEDAELAGAAAGALARLEPRLAASFLAEAADADTLAWFAESAADSQVLEAVVRRRDVPRPLLAALAPRVPPELQEVLLLRQDAIVELPAILEGLEENPRLTPYARRRIAEYREHLLPPPAAPAAPAAAPDGGAEAGGGDAAELEEEAAASPLAVEGTTGLTEWQIRSLPVPSRLKLARGASRALRKILIRDSNPLVALAVLEHNVLTEQEVAQIAHNRLVPDEVLEEIGRRRQWVAKYPIVRALVHNPRTPVPLSLRLLGRLNFRDLRDLSRNHNTPGPVRAAALRLYRMRHR